MRLGCCISGGDQLAALERAGAEYCELPVARALMESDEAFEQLAARLDGSPVPALACNVFLPGGLKVVGPDVDAGALGRYVETALARMERVGARVLVVGSGTARTVPDGFDRERALAQFESLLGDVARRGAGHGVTVVLEPLRPAETNLLNTVAESAAFLAERDAGPARLLADLYHMREQSESLDVLAAVVDRLAHVHVAGVGRGRPGPDAEDLEPFLRELCRAGYRGDCSIECGWKDFAAEAPLGLEHLRLAAGHAGWPSEAGEGG
jgi:sugar phosphate isomerase/epimerase